MTHAEDLALLRRFEPILRFNRGERFFPMASAEYVSESSLWLRRKGEKPILVVPQADLNLDVLAEPRMGGFDSRYYMQFIDEIDAADLIKYNREHTRRKLHERDVFRSGGGRLSKVGYISRFINALFQFSLLTRGRVPGGTAAAAAMRYEQILERNPHYKYHGRIIRDRDWTVLQYWLFYAYNDWRSRFFGINDHEADWEHVDVFVYQDEYGDVQPEWVAYSAHISGGDDIRRRWDDPEVEKLGEHPVVYVGAGSHASYYRAGEYITEVELPLLAPLARLNERINKLRKQALESYQAGAQIQEQVEDTSDINIFLIPFIDYARGDGWQIGPGTDWDWSEPEIITNPPNWVRNYRGLWGLYTRDLLGGEDAPSGPMHERDGAVRRSWYDPVGWVGLDKVPPHSKALEVLQMQRAEVSARIEYQGDNLERLQVRLNRLGTKLEAMRGRSHLQPIYEARVEEANELSNEIRDAKRSLTEDEALLQALDSHGKRIGDGYHGPMRAHITRPHEPISEENIRTGRIAEFWAAVSVSLSMIVFVATIAFNRESLLLTLAWIIGIFVVIEAGFRRQFGRLITIITVILALVSAVVLLADFLWEIISAVVIVGGLYLLIENLKELRR